YLSLMRHAVDQIIDAQLVGFVRVVEWSETATRPLPVLGDVRVVVFDHHQPLARIVVLEQPAKHRPPSNVGLRKVVDRFDLEKGVEDWLRGIQIDETSLRKYALHVGFERLQPAAAAGVIAPAPAEAAETATHFEVVDDEESALL